MVKYLGFFASIISLVAAGAAGQEPLRVAATAVTNQFHPSLMRGNDDRFAKELIHARLLKINERWQYECHLCESIPVFPITKSKEKPKARTEVALVWKIHKNAKWGNGVPITGWDVRFAYEIAQASAKLSGTNPRSAIRSIIVNDQDASEFTVQLDSPTSDYLVDLDFPLLPASIEEPIWIGAEKNIDRYLNSSEYSKNPLNPALYAGCYLPTTKHQDGITFDASKHCKEGPPAIAQLRTLVDRGNWREVAARGSVDIIPETILTLDQAEDLNDWLNSTPDSAAKWQLHSGGDGSIEFLLFNLRNPAFADRKVRQAIALAIDASILTKARRGLPDQPPGVFPAVYLGLPDQKWPHQTNPQQAKDMLRQLRWTPDPSGMLHRDGKAMGFEITISDQPVSRRIIATKIAEMLKGLGADAKVRTVSESDFRANVFTRSNFSDLLLLRWRFQPAMIPFAILHSTQIPSVENDYSGQNISGIFSKKLDDLLIAWATEHDPGAQATIRQAINQLFAEEIYAVPLSEGKQSALVSKRVSGFRMTNQDRPSSAFAQGWKL